MGGPVLQNKLLSCITYFFIGAEILQQTMEQIPGKIRREIVLSAVVNRI